MKLASPILKKILIKLIFFDETDWFSLILLYMGLPDEVIVAKIILLRFSEIFVFVNPIKIFKILGSVLLVAPLTHLPPPLLESLLTVGFSSNSHGWGGWGWWGVWGPLQKFNHHHHCQRKKN